MKINVFHVLEARNVANFRRREDKYTNIVLIYKMQNTLARPGFLR